MPCYHPLRAFQCADGTVVFHENGRFNIVRSLFLPCGQCIGCRLERSRQWAIRCMHEASLYDRNCFITLTYDDEHLTSPSLEYRDFQLFMKRLRKKFTKEVIRFYMCGEYGENFGRPHFHACLFNYDFADKLYFKKAGDAKLYTSGTLAELWGKGFSLIGSVTFESAAYVARYCVAKKTGRAAAAHYRAVSTETGEITNYTPEFNHMSLRPGIGAAWLRRHWADVYPHGNVVVRGRRMKPPKYYDRVCKRFADDDWADIVYTREQLAHKVFGDNTPERLATKEIVAKARLSQFLRRQL